MVAAYAFYPMDPTIWMPIIAFSCIVVKWNVTFFNSLFFFLVKLLKLQKMSDWNELSSIPGKWKFCRIYWQWILIEQTSLYTVVYRTFLYNPTNLTVPKKAPCMVFKNIPDTDFDYFYHLRVVAADDPTEKRAHACSNHFTQNLSRMKPYNLSTIALYKTHDEGHKRPPYPVESRLSPSVTEWTS